MATTGTDISKDLAIIKGQLSATATRLSYIMVNHGEELLSHDSGQEKPEVPVGVHVFHLLIQLEIYREHVDKFTTSVRQKYGMKELVIRRDQKKLRNQFMDNIKELQDEIKDLNTEQLRSFLDEKVPFS
jgi:hypothetical protein